jgi:HTH-type transcriptional regulator / antitoxin HigA
MQTDADFQTPGQLIEKLLAERDWTQKFLAILMGVSEDIVSRMIVGKRPVDAKMALELADIFGIEPERFLRLQQSYDLKLAELTTKRDPARVTRHYLFGNLPISEMIKRRWLKVESVKDVDGVERELKRFFGVQDLNEIETLPHAAMKTPVVGTSTEKLAYGAQMSWIYRVQTVAKQMIVSPYSQLAVRRVINDLQPLMMSPESVRKVPRLLAEAGIRFVIVETIGPAKIDGVTFWLDDYSPVIGMTLRYDRIDNFWFVLRHELEHVDKMHGRGDAIRLDAELEGAKAGFGQDIEEEERIANAAAANYGFSQEYLQKFIIRKSPLFREIDVLGFAKVCKVHPGIVVGRLQRATDRYDLLRKHLVSIRPKITPDALVDGWGEEAPVN